MSCDSRSSFSSKHEAGSRVDPVIRQQLEAHAKNGEISCAVAFEVARICGTSPDKIGKNADLMELRLVKCQMGLFGYHPEKKKVTPSSEPDESVRNEISAHLIDGKLPCKSAWEIASRLNMRKMQISSVCETLGIKISNCQLGAF